MNQWSLSTRRSTTEPRSVLGVVISTFRIGLESAGRLGETSEQNQMRSEWRSKVKAGAYNKKVCVLLLSLPRQVGAIVSDWDLSELDQHRSSVRATRE